MTETGGRVAGRVAIVTGAASGLGKCTAEMLAAEGAKVVLTDIDPEGVQAAAGGIGGNALALEQDVTDEARWQSVIAETVEAFGGLHILVNNAGIGTPGTVEETSFEDWRRVHAVDLDSVFLGCKYACRPMADSVRGRGTTGSIVNISSVAGIIAAANLAAYNSAKAAVRHLTKSVALHCARRGYGLDRSLAKHHHQLHCARRGYGIRCNSIHPAFVDTPILDQVGGRHTTEEIKAKMARQLPLRHIGEPSDVGHAVLYLASEESRFMTGAELVIDGGVSAM